MIADLSLSTDDSADRAIRLVGHDLRNNLSVMGNSVYYLNMKIAQEDEKLAKHIAILSREISASTRTVANLMELVAANNPNPVQTDINALVQQVLSRVPAPEGVRTETQLEADPILIEVDSTQMALAMENILSYRYAALREGGRLWVGSYRDGRVYIGFTDSGPVLSDEEMALLFDVEQADGSSSLHLGLAAARRLVQLNRGSLEVESGPAVGTRFRIMLPPSS